MRVGITIEQNHVSHLNVVKVERSRFSKEDLGKEERKISVKKKRNLGQDQKTTLVQKETTTVNEVSLLIVKLLRN